MFLKSNVWVHFETIASLGDQPERRSVNNLMLGNSTSLSRYRYSANVKKISQYLPPCDQWLESTRCNKKCKRSRSKANDVSTGLFWVIET